jgi:hypothetical protein
VASTALSATIATMALGGRTRTLEVDGVSYRWRVGRTRFGQRLKAYVQGADGIGAGLEMTMPACYEIGSRRGVQQVSTIDPGDLSRAIAKARAQGWVPGEAGRDRQIALDVQFLRSRSRWFANAEPLHIPCRNWALQVDGIAIDSFPEAAEPELVLFLCSGCPGLVTLHDARLGQLWFENFHADIFERDEPPTPRLLQSSHVCRHEIEDSESVCWRRGDEVAGATGPLIDRPEPEDAVVAETYFRVRHRDLAASWSAVVALLRDACAGRQ